MPNERLTTDYVEGWHAGAREVHVQVVRDLRPLFVDLMDTYPETRGALTGIYSLLYGMPMPTPKRVEPSKNEPANMKEMVRGDSYD